MARFFFLHFSPSVAQQFIDRGLRLAKNSAPLTMLAGMSEEIREDRAAVIPNYSSPMSRLTYAESFYRRALTLDPHLTEARLRLGRVLFLRNQREPARHELVSVTQISRDPALLYLAHLFQGALAQSVSDFQSARREYQLALELGPRYQTASIALSFVEHLAGRESAAREVMAQWQESRRSPSDESDPWWDYRSGRIDLDALAWLRAQVHQ